MACLAQPVDVNKTTISIIIAEYFSQDDNFIIIANKNKIH